MFQRAFYSAFASRADQLVHEQRAQTTSAHNSKPLRHTDAHEYRGPMQRSGRHCTATRHSFEMLRVDLRSKRIHGMRQKLGDEPGARALPAAAHNIFICSLLYNLEVYRSTFAHDACTGSIQRSGGCAEEVRNVGEEGAVGGRCDGE